MPADSLALAGESPLSRLRPWHRAGALEPRQIAFRQFDLAISPPRHVQIVQCRSIRFYRMAEIWTSVSVTCEKFPWRPRPESNRGKRICSPVHHHSATRPFEGGGGLIT